MYGCLLGYTSIAAEMKDAELVKLVKTIGYKEGLPVVTDPGIISPKAFIDEVVEQRLPNPFIPSESFSAAMPTLFNFVRSSHATEKPIFVIVMHSL